HRQNVEEAELMAKRHHAGQPFGRVFKEYRDADLVEDFRLLEIKRGAGEKTEQADRAEEMGDIKGDRALYRETAREQPLICRETAKIGEGGRYARDEDEDFGGVGEPVVPRCHVAVDVERYV